MNLYLTRSGRLIRKDNTLKFETVKIPENEEYDWQEEVDTLGAVSSNTLPIESIDAIYIFGCVSLNTKLIDFLAYKRIPVHFFNWYGSHTSTMLPHAEQLSGELVIRQGQAYLNHDERMTICRALLNSTFHNIVYILQYYNRRRGGLEEVVEEVKQYQKNLQKYDSVEALMGIEGNVRKLYYHSWKTWMGPSASHFKRIYHPADNPLNAMISFLNSLLYTVCVSELYRTALYAGISYLHTPQTRRFSLALDLVEPFKPIIADRLLFRLFDCKMITDKDFKKFSNGYILTDEARKKVLQEWDAELRKTILCEKLGRAVSYRQLMRLDCYKLINFLLEQREYLPYRIQEY